MDIYIKPTFDCLIVMHGQEWTLSCGRVKCFDITADEPLTALVYPLSRGMISYAFSLNLHDLSTTCDYIDIVEIKNGAFITLLPLILPNNGSLFDKKSTMNFASRSHTLHYSTPSLMRLRLQCEREFVDLCFDRIIYSVDTISSSQSLMIYCECEGGYVVTLVTMKDGKYLVEFIKEVMLVEKDKNTITILSPMHDSLHHGLVEKYDISQDFSKTRDIVYIDGKDFPHVDNALVPYVFLDAVHCEDYLLAKTYLSPTLSERLDSEHIRAFFGNFESIFSAYWDSEGGVAVTHRENGKKYAKVYHFDINADGKIQNILED